MANQQRRNILFLLMLHGVKKYVNTRNNSTQSYLFFGGDFTWLSRQQHPTKVVFLNERIFLPTEITMENKNLAGPNALEHQEETVATRSTYVLQKTSPSFSEEVDAAAALYDCFVNAPHAVHQGDFLARNKVAAGHEVPWDELREKFAVG